MLDARHGRFAAGRSKLAGRPRSVGWCGWHSAGALAGDEILIALRRVTDRQFEHAIEHHAAAAGAAAVEAEHELVEIADQVGVVDGALVGSPGANAWPGRQPDARRATACWDRHQERDRR